MNLAEQNCTEKRVDSKWASLQSPRVSGARCLSKTDQEHLLDGVVSLEKTDGFFHRDMGGALEREPIGARAD